MKMKMKMVMMLDGASSWRGLILVRFGDFQRLLLLSRDGQMKWSEKSFAIFTFTL